MLRCLKSNVFKTMWKEDVIQFEVPVGICLEKERIQKVMNLKQCGRKML
jgi:hypothetical protein